MTKGSSGNKEHMGWNFFFGAFSGAIAKTVCAPIERVKLLM